MFTERYPRSSTCLQQTDCAACDADPPNLIECFQQCAGDPWVEDTHEVTCGDAHGHYIPLADPRLRGVACGFYKYPDDPTVGWRVTNFFNSIP